MLNLVDQNCIKDDKSYEKCIKSLRDLSSKIEKNYIGGATFLEIYDAFRLGKKIYLYNDVPEGILYDEIQGFNPFIINADLSKIK